MKKIVGLILTIIIPVIVYADIIPQNCHSVSKCVKITNVGDYPHLTIFAKVIPIGSAKDYIYEINSNTCLTKGYKFNQFYLYATYKTDLESSNFEKINLFLRADVLPSDKKISPQGGFIHDSIPIKRIESFYKIVGFTDSSMVLHKYKEIHGFNNDKPDTTFYWEYEGDLSTLKSSVLGLREFKFEMDVEVYPNPAGSEIYYDLESKNFYGNYEISLVTMDGRLVKKEVHKSLKGRFDLHDVTNGIYILYFRFGEMIKPQKIIVQH